MDQVTTADAIAGEGVVFPALPAFSIWQRDPRKSFFFERSDFSGTDSGTTTHCVGLGVTPLRNSSLVRVVGTHPSRSMGEKKRKRRESEAALAEGVPDDVEKSGKKKSKKARKDVVPALDNEVPSDVSQVAALVSPIATRTIILSSIPPPKLDFMVLCTDIISCHFNFVFLQQWQVVNSLRRYLN